jgi:hypothetical protein
VSENRWDISIPSILDIEERLFYKVPGKRGDSGGDGDPDQDTQWLWARSDVPPKKKKDWHVPQI